MYSLPTFIERLVMENALISSSGRIILFGRISKSDSAIWKVGHGGCADFTVKLFIKQETLSCEFLAKEKK